MTTTNEKGFIFSWIMGGFFVIIGVLNILLVDVVPGLIYNGHQVVTDSYFASSLMPACSRPGSSCAHARCARRPAQDAAQRLSER